MLLAAAVLGFPKPLPSIPPPVAPFGMEQLPLAPVTYPIVFPVLGEPKWRNSYNEPRSNYRHTGIDMAGPKMTPILAPFSGVINLKVMSFWIVADDGWRCLLTHLNDDNIGTNDNHGDVDLMFAPNLKPGQRVEAGQFIGYMGDSGWATGPHLHFEIYSPKGIRNPLWSLKKAIKIKTPTYKIPAPEEKPREETERFEACPRGFDEASQVLKVILVARQKPDGSVKVVTTPTYAYVIIPEEHGLGPIINNLPHYEPLSLYVRRQNGIWLAEEIIIRSNEPIPLDAAPNIKDGMPPLGSTP